MGASCTTSNRLDLYQEIDREPHDTEAYNKPGLPALDFIIEVTKIKLRMMSELPAELAGQKACIQLSIDGVLEEVLESQMIDNVMKWSQTFRARMTVNQYELRKKYMRLNIFSQSRIKLSAISFNLYNVSVGPYHQDFPVKFSDKKEGRISLDIKISQLVPLLLKTIKIGVELVTEHPGEVFHYSLKTTNDEGKELESKQSYRAETILYNKKLMLTEADRPALSLQRRVSLKSKKSLVLEKGNKLAWSNEQSHQQANEELPQLQITVDVSRIPGYSFEFILWRVQSDTVNEHNESISEEIHLYADTFINFNRIFINQPKIILHDNNQYEFRETRIVQKIWNQGKLLGTVTMLCQTLLPVYNKQMLVCVRTEKGILADSTPFSGQMRKNISNCTEIKKLNELKNTISDTIVDLSINKTDRKHSEYKIMNTKRTVCEGIGKIFVILQSSASKHKKMYNYKSEQDITKGQMVLLEIGSKLLEGLGLNDPCISEHCWKALTELLSRQELNLIHLSHNHKESSDKVIKNKNEVCLRYQSFLYKTLGVYLECLNKKAFLENQKNFVILFSAQSFIRIPEFRKMALSSMSKGEMEKDLIQQIGYGSNEPSHFDSSLKPLLDWQGNFYDSLKNIQGYEENMLILNDILESQENKKKVSQRSLGFFLLVGQYMQSVKRQALNTQILWQRIPGYVQLVRMFFCQMLTRDIIRYPDGLKETSVKLLCNQQLLNVQLKLLFSRTNIHKPMQAIKTLEILDAYMSYYARCPQNRLPSSFNYKYFYIGIKTLISCDHSFVVAKTLSLLYKHYTLFSGSFRKDLSLCLMGSYFFKLFLSWASNIRMMFHYLLLYRFHMDSYHATKTKVKYREAPSLMTNLFVLDELQAMDIRNRYEQGMEVLEQYVRSTKKARVALQPLYHKKMKTKLMEMRMKQKSTSGGSVKSMQSVRAGSSDNFLHTLKELQPMRCSSQVTPLKEMVMNNKSAGDWKKDQSESRDARKRFPSALLTEISEVEDVKQKRRKRLNSFEADFQLAEIQSFMLSYLQVSMRQFSDMETIYQKTMSPNFNHANVPSICVKIPMDEGDIRPDDIDEW